ncbi:MAG TPA: diaminopimelate epimerase [bacterium]|jgi:diaminopimelate epimerase
MNIPFSKYHGLGNDFILMEDRDRSITPTLTPPIIRFLCDRHIGLGADGILVRQPTSEADHRMVLFNADGSPAEISGNGMRCFVLFLKECGYGVDKDVTIQTGGGIQRARMVAEDSVEGTMPRPRFVRGAGSSTGNGKPELLDLRARDKHFMVAPVNVGNPHGVIFGEERDIAFAETYGPVLEKHPAFPEGANIEFVNVISPIACRLVVWERGAGITLACGSGSTATACAGAALGHFEFNQPIAVIQPGGTLHITVSDTFSEIRQRGPAKFVFKGEVEI